MSRSPRTVAPEEALRLLGPGADVVTSIGCATPHTLLAALAGDTEPAPGATVHAGLLVGQTPFYDAVAAGRLSLNSWHIPSEARSLSDRHLLSYIPLRASAVGSYLDRGFDACLLRVGPPDSQGYCSLGPSLTYIHGAVLAARTVVAEIDASLPPTRGHTRVHHGRFDMVVEADRPMPIFRSASSATARSISERVLSLLPESPTLQLGIGAVPHALTELLLEREVTDIRFLGMATDAMGDLLASGGADSIEAVEILGGGDLMRLAETDHRFRMVSSTSCHDARITGRRRRLVSVNSALAIDLRGQAASEGLGGRIVSGIGGSVDFFEAARWSRGGVRVLALTACAADGTSRIVSNLPAGTPVTIPAHLTDVVVTEFGTARLAGLSAPDRARALIEIAAPGHRESLAAQAGC